MSDASVARVRRAVNSAASRQHDEARPRPLPPASSRRPARTQQYLARLTVYHLILFYSLIFLREQSCPVTDGLPSVYIYYTEPYAKREGVRPRRSGLS